MKFTTHLGDAGAIWIVTAITLLLFKKTRKAGICLGVSLIVTAILGNVVLKNIFARTRPFIEANYPIIINAPGGFSFPSGHTSSSFAAATAIALYFKKWSVPSFVLASLIALSRVYLYVHYPSDIIAGAILGIIITIICDKLLRKKENCE